MIKRKQTERRDDLTMVYGVWFMVYNVYSISITIVYFLFFEDKHFLYSLLNYINYRIKLNFEGFF